MNEILFEEGGLSETVLEISWSKIQNNISNFRKKQDKNSLLMLMVKASAYGNGAVGICKLVEENQLADYLGVASLDEGIELRDAGIHLPIMVQNPIASRWDVLVEYCLEAEIHSLDLLTSFSEFLAKDDELLNSQYPIHLKFNTGMNRLGIDSSELDQLIIQLKNKKGWQVKSILTHLSSAGMKEEDEFTLKQIKEFEQIHQKLKPYLPETLILHALNTSGMERHSDAQFNMIRLGIGLYGGAESNSMSNALQASSKLSTQVISTRKVKEGDSISYSRSGRAQKDTNIAILSIGYADGFPIKMGNGNWQLEVNGKLYPTIGVVCMDLCMINTGEDALEVGSEAIVFGGQKSIFEYAEALDTIVYEALTIIGSRVKRRIVN